ncbi:unnamed protein product [Moneuplotes crassus]|uniref:Uncharacterized protein n=2 Tax=Euplotes crassus TaxID=5936 RepID=A0AAD1XAT5_EUPCR|nr:unnamed protein product [Moneuplotes crassus]
MLQNNYGFSKPVTFTKNGKEKYKTLCGGLTTIFIFLALIGYGIILITSPFIQKINSIEVGPVTGDLSCNSGGGNTGGNTGGYFCQNVTTCPENSQNLCSSVSGTVETDDEVPFVMYNKVSKVPSHDAAYKSTFENYIFTNGFRIAFKWRDHLFDPKSFSFISLLGQSEDGGETKSSVSLSMVPCTTAMFPTEISGELTDIGITDYVCIDPTHYSSFYLKQNLRGGNFSFGLIGLFECSSDCDGGTSIDGTTLDVLMIEGNYDILNSTNPVKYTINDKYEIPLNPDGVYYYDFKLQRNGYVPNGGSQSYFYKVIKNNDGYQKYSGTQNLVTITLTMDDTQIDHNSYVEYQPVINSQQMSVGDTLPEGTTMENCEWIY